MTNDAHPLPRLRIRELQFYYSIRLYVVITAYITYLNKVFKTKVGDKVVRKRMHFYKHFISTACQNQRRIKPAAATRAILHIYGLGVDLFSSHDSHIKQIYFKMLCKIHESTMRISYYKNNPAFGEGLASKPKQFVMSIRPWANVVTECTAHFPSIILLNNQLDALFKCIYLFHFSTCFEQPSAHHLDNQLYQYIIWYISLCVGECLVRRYTQSDIYQIMYWYNWFSWWWALGCSKHVEKWNKYTGKVRQVGY
jgi:hypothetical protein